MQLPAVSRWLLDAKGIAVQEEWLEACIEWIIDEEGSAVPQRRVQEMVYEQWLHADLKDVVTSASIPEVIHQQQRGQVEGTFVVQVVSAVDVGKPAYSQLQKLKGQSLDSAEQPDKKYSEPKPTRLLLMDLSDGVGELQAMEYQHIPQLSDELLPGAKLMLQGVIQFHLGVLLLCASDVQVLGGRVEHLVELNQPRRVLARILNNEDLAGDARSAQNPQNNIRETETETNPHSHSHTLPHEGREEPSTHTSTAPAPEVHSSSTHLPRDSHLSSLPSHSHVGVGMGAITHTSTTAGATSFSANPQSNSHSHRGVGMKASEDGAITGRSDIGTLSAPDDVTGVDFGGDIDMEDFEDFLDADKEEDNILQGCEEDFMHDADVPGHEQWPDEDYHHHDQPVESHDNFQETAIVEPPRSTGACVNTGRVSSVPHSREPQSCNRFQLDGSDGSNMHVANVGTRTKLSLKEKPTRLRTCVVSQPASSRNPLVAAIKPFQRQQQVAHTESVSATSSDSNKDEQPMTLESLSELTQSLWKHHCSVKVKAHFVKVCQKLVHEGGEWMTTVVVGDDCGIELQVHISNEILEPLIGFSASEFRDYIVPNKTERTVRAKASRGFAYCQSAIARLDCFMVLEKRHTHSHPFIVQLLDS